MQKYKIPQNVQIEDKIFGNILTLRQLIIIGLGGGISYIIYTILARTYILGTIEIGLILIPAAISVAFAFIKINNVSLFKYCLLFLEFVIKPQRRVWNKKGNIILTLKTTTQKPKKDNKKGKDAKKPMSKQEALSKLDELTNMLDSSGQFDHMEQKELKVDDAHDHHLIHHAYFPEKDHDDHHERVDTMMKQKTA